MKRPSFIQGVGVAGGLAFAAAAFVVALGPILVVSTLGRLLIPALALAYILYLFGRSPERTGRVTVLCLWAVLAIAAWLFIASFPVYVLTHAAAIWLVRSLYFHGGVLTSLLDLGLTAFASAFAAGVFLHTGSVLLATWCFFLSQAVFVGIPPSFAPGEVRQHTPTDFDRASRQADAALRQLIARH